VSTPNIYSLMIGGAWSSDVASVIEKIPGRGLAYFDGTDVKQNYSTGVPYADASANGWLLKDSAGNLMSTRPTAPIAPTSARPATSRRGSRTS
jgi:hypothetical protein